MYFSACKQYFEKYPGDHELLWEVEGVGHWYQRIPVTRALQRETFKITGKNYRFQVETHVRLKEQSLLMFVSLSPELRYIVV